MEHRIIAILAFTVCLAMCLTSKAQVLSPDDFFYRPYGKSFTEHHDLINYIQHLAANSSRIEVEEYGRSVQGRPLISVYIGSPDRIGKFEAVRANHMRWLGFEESSRPEHPDIPIVWLSFGIHGNEPGATESSIALLYYLADPSNTEVDEWLQDVFIVIDPCLNPDGYMRYVHWFNNTVGRVPNANPDSREHNEPWPGGRSNHYLIDLNRDWAWQTQHESRLRMQHYYRWMPHIHADYHEQFINDPYFFPPMAHPVHQSIESWQKQVLDELGSWNAQMFDQKGWLYFTGEWFDMFYPSYGDTYPSLNGAVGLTYEKAGHSKAGLAIVTATGDTLKLADRIVHHKSTALTTIRYAVERNDFLVQEQIRHFNRYRQLKDSETVTFLIRGQDFTGRSNDLLRFLDRSGIKYAMARSGISLNARHYMSMQNSQIITADGDIAVSIAQPLMAKVKTFFEPEPVLTDSLTYDITAWALPFAYNLDAWVVNGTVPVYSMDLSNGQNYDNIPVFPEAYAFAFRKESMRDFRLMSSLMQSGIRLRYLSEPAVYDQIAFDRGTILILRADNQKHEDYGRLILEKAARFEVPVYTIQSGRADEGPDMGSSGVRFIAPPRVATITGQGVSSASLGEIWHLFDEEWQYPITLLPGPDLLNHPIDDYDVLILPEGWYPLNGGIFSRLSRWVEKGGRLILLGNINSRFEGAEGFLIKRFATDFDRMAMEQKREQLLLDNRLRPYTDQMRSQVSGSIPGAVIELQLDASHPLAFGLGNRYYTLKTNNTLYTHMQGIWNVAFSGDQPATVGFIGSEIKPHIGGNTHFGVQQSGRGSVVYLTDNPLFRGFWNAGKVMFGNAVFIVGQ